MGIFRKKKSLTAEQQDSQQRFVAPLKGKKTRARRNFRDSLILARLRGKRDLPEYPSHGKSPDWKKELGPAAKALEGIIEGLGKGKKAKYLEIGPGFAEHLKQMIKEEKRVEVNTLSPDNINPKKIKKGGNGLKTRIISPNCATMWAHRKALMPKNWGSSTSSSQNSHRLSAADSHIMS